VVAKESLGIELVRVEALDAGTEGGEEGVRGARES